MRPYVQDCPYEDCGVPTFNKYQSSTFVPIACDACGEGSCIKTTIGEQDRCTLSTDEFSLYLVSTMGSYGDVILLDCI